MSLSATLPACRVTGPPLAPRRAEVIAASSGDRAAVLLAHAVSHPAPPRPRLPGRLRLARPAGHAADRAGRAASRGALPRPARRPLRLRLRRLPPGAEPLLARRVGPRAGRRRLARRRPLAPGAPRLRGRDPDGGAL